jgi:hypothetical protein
MNRIVAALTLGTLFLSAAPGRSDERPYLDFVRALRARNYNEEAILYLDSLSEKKLPKDIASFLPIEKATCRLEMAVQEADQNRRTALFERARGELEEVIKNQPGTAFAALALLDKARITVLQGRAGFVHARQMRKDEGALKNEMTKVHDLFVAAEEDLKNAGDQVENQLKREHPKAVEEALKKAKLRAQMEMAVNQIDQASTYEALGKNLDTRGKMIERAIKELSEIYEKNNKSSVGWEARVWKGRGHTELDKGEEGKKDFEACEKLEIDSPLADPARRQAKYFHFLVPLITLGPNPVVSPAEQKKVGEDWLKDYPGYANTFEGNHIRFELANLYKADGIAAGTDKNGKMTVTDKVKDILNKAVALYEELEKTENEFKNEASNNKFDIMILISDQTKVTEAYIDSLKTFDALMQTATTIELQFRKEQSDIAQLQYNKELTAEQRKKLEIREKEFPEFHKAQLAKYEHALNRALELADKKTDPGKVAAARAMLAWVVMENGNPYRAAIIGEHAAALADQAPTSPEPAKAAAYALQAYSLAIFEGGRDGLDNTILDADRERLKKLAKTMEARWKESPETNAARFQVGTLLLREKKYKEAEEYLSRVTDKYEAAALTDARFWWAVACAQALEELGDKITEEEKKLLKDHQTKALQGIPETLPADVPTSIATAYVQGKLMYGGVLFDDKHYDQLEKLGNALVDRINKFKLDEQFREDSLKRAQSLAYYASLGRASNEASAGKYTEAVETIDKVLKKVQDIYKQLSKPEKDLRNEYAAVEAKLKDLVKLYRDDKNKEEEVIDLAKLEKNPADKDKYQKLSVQLEEVKDKINAVVKQSELFSKLYRSMLTVALRACVLGGNNARAKKIFPDLQELAARDPAGAGTRIYQQLAVELRGQIEELKKQPKKTAELKQLQSNFSAFLKNLSEQPDFKPENIFTYERKADQPNPHVGLVFFLIECYSGLEQHADAATVLSRIPLPKPVPPNPKPDPKDENLYRFAQLRYAKELRLGKKFEEAHKTVDQIQKQDWGKGIEPKKEKAMIYHDEGRFAPATGSWSRIIQDFGQRPNFTNSKIKEEYFEAYFHFLDCKYKFANSADPRSKEDLKKKDVTIEDRRKALIKDVAKRIAELDANTNRTEFYNKSIAELLKKEKPLHEEYEVFRKEKEKEAKEKEKEAKEKEKEAKEKEKEQPKEKDKPKEKEKEKPAAKQ